MRFKVASFFYLIFLWIIQIKQTFIDYGFGALQWIRLEPIQTYQFSCCENFCLQHYSTFCDYIYIYIYGPIWIKGAGRRGSGGEQNRVDKKQTNFFLTLLYSPSFPSIQLHHKYFSIVNKGQNKHIYIYIYIYYIFHDSFSLFY